LESLDSLGSARTSCLLRSVLWKLICIRSRDVLASVYYPVLRLNDSAFSNTLATIRGDWQGTTMIAALANDHKPAYFGVHTFLRTNS
jgi:hypothetical protein